MIDLLAWADDRLDLTGAYCAASLGGAIAALWLMLCMTRHAGFSSRRALGGLVRRLALATLSATLFATAFAPLLDGAPPAAADAVLRVVLFVCLLSRGFDDRPPPAFRAA